MRTDLLPLCDKHFRTMEACIAPYSPDFSIDFFRCTEKFCGRCFGERVGYAMPRRDGAPDIVPNQPRCDLHGRPMFIISLDRQHNRITYACTDPGCTQRVLKA